MDDISIVQAVTIVEDKLATMIKAPEIDIEKHEEKETIITIQDTQQKDEDEDCPSSLPISKSLNISLDIDNRHNSCS